MNKLMLLIGGLFLLLGCESGVRSNGQTNEIALPDSVTKTNNGAKSSAKVEEKGYVKNSSKIFSKSGQPGYYLQMAVFAKNKPSKEFLNPLSKSSFKYTVLKHRDRDYVLIGPYISYNSAKKNVDSIKKTLKKQTFVVQVLRP